MKKSAIVALGMICALALTNSPVFAIKAFNDQFTKLYVGEAKDSPLAKELEKAKCNLCHEGTAKKNRNEYGVAVSKLLKKADYSTDKLTADPEGTAKAIVEALQKVEAEKSKDGSTFGEKIKAGKLPAAAK